MQIAIIGTGNVGSALGGSLVRAGHTVTFAGRDVEKATKLAADLGAAVASTPAAAVADADVIVLAVPFGAVGSLATAIAPLTTGKVVIDATNRLKPDYSGLASEDGSSAAEQIAIWFEGASVVKAFNTLFASIQADPASLGQTVDLLIAADDAAAKSLVAQLATSIGLRPVDAGSLMGAREMEAIAWLNMSLQMRTSGNWNSSFVLLGAPDKAIAA